MPLWFTRVAALVLLSLPLCAQGPVQLMFSGEITNEHGSSIDLEISARCADGSESKGLSLHMALLRSTSARDVAALLDARLTEARIRHVAPAPASERGQATIFLEGVTRVLVRASDGLHVSIGLSEGAPSSVQLLPPLARRGKANLRFHGLTNDVRLRARGTVDFGVDFEADATPTQTVEALANACSAARWLSERPSHETWRPSHSYEGVDLVGTSFELDTTAADWGIELRLE